MATRSTLEIMIAAKAVSAGILHRRHSGEANGSTLFPPPLVSAHSAPELRTHVRHSHSASSSDWREPGEPLARTQLLEKGIITSEYRRLSLGSRTPQDINFNNRPRRPLIIV